RDRAGDKQGEGCSEYERTDINPYCSPPFATVESFCNELQPGHVRAAHADAGQGAEEHGGRVVVGKECKEEIGATRPDCRNDEDLPDAETVGKGAEYNSGEDVAELVDRKDRACHGVAHPPFFLEKREDGGVVDEHEHNEKLCETEKQKPAGVLVHVIPLRHIPLP